MLKFSASYTKVNPNFTIENIKACDTDYKPIFAVLNNILQRGCPTIPSKYLQKHFNTPNNRKNFEYNYNFSNCNWDYIVKGGTNSNPALNFYKTTLPQILGNDYAKTFIAECPLVYIIELFEKNQKISEQVDFYSPLFNAVIEIDGLQHKTNAEQNIKDKNRDNLLEKNNIKIIRISTKELDNLELIKEKLKTLKYNNDYKKAVFGTKTIYDNDIYYMTAIRMEMLLLSLYENNYIKLNEDNVVLNIYTADNTDKIVFDICINDFMVWLKSICVLQNVEFEIPKVEVNIIKSENDLSKKQGINIVISLKDVYSQTNFENVIYVKNDFFLYENDLISSKDQHNGINTYSYRKNYFAVKSQKIHYELTKEKHSKVLTYILSNVSNIYENFRENQLDIIIECLNNRSVIGVLPTGAGKSLCYQLASLLIPSSTLMIAPLQLLMVDQYENIKEKLGINNLTYINSTKRENLNIFTKGKSLITIISPERFFSEKFTKALMSELIKIGFIVIDEAHCLSEWGHDFRTSYLCLSHNLNRFLPSDTFLMALTGTASHRVFEDIDCEFQNFKKKKTNAIFADNMRRENLTIFISRTEDKYKELIDNISPTLFGINKDKTLIFTKKKNNNSNPFDSACITLTNTIKTQFEGIADTRLIEYYSGGDELSTIEKEQTLQDFKDGKALVVLATKAFGMGVDIPDVRKTIHYGLPSSFESLYQQFGRAGRDGKSSKCYVYYTPENKDNLDKFFSMPPISIKEMAEHLKELDELQTNFYFIQSANLDVDIEKIVVERLLKGIKTRNSLSIKFVDCKTIIEGPFKEINDKHLNSICKNVDAARIIIERALYRLFILGEIEMWSLVYDSDISNPTFNNLNLTKLSEEDKLEKLKSHIEKYETNFIFNQPNTFENRLTFLLKWAHENYLQERIQTMKTLYEQCEYFTTSDTFMSYIANYFSNDPIYMRLVDRNVKLKEWIDALKTHPEKTKARIARLLESYDKIDALNYVSGITRLRLDEFDSTDGKRRLELALESISKYSTDKRTYLFDKTITLLNKTQKDLFIECWLIYCKDDVFDIYQKTNSQVCENYLIINFTNEIIKIGEEMNDRL